MNTAKIIQFGVPLYTMPENELYQFICEECEGDTFNLMDNGEVWRATCQGEAEHLVCGERNA